MDVDNSEGSRDVSLAAPIGVEDQRDKVEGPPKGVSAEVSAVTLSPTPCPRDTRPQDAIHLKYQDIDESLLHFNDAVLNRFMQGYTIRKRFVESTLVALAHERVEGLSQIFKLHTTLKVIANKHIITRENLTDGLIASHSLNH